MKHPFAHPVIVWLCLIWFGLANSVFAGSVVICNDGHGVSRIEWGCNRTDSGECASACAEEHAEEDPAAPHPCEDTPVASELPVTKSPRRGSVETIVAVPVVMAEPVHWVVLPAPSRLIFVSSGPDRPPDRLKHIRTVVRVI